MKVAFYEMAARKKAHENARVSSSEGTLDNGFEFFSWQALDSGGVLLKGGVPRLLKSGPRKGQKTWRGQPCRQFTVSTADAERERAAYEQSTGKCRDCLGDGRELVSWDRQTGFSYKACDRCQGEGKAP